MKIGNIVSGKVKFITKTYIVVELPNEFSGLLRISEASDYFVNNIGSMFKLNQSYDFLVTFLDEEAKRVKLSWKKIIPRYLKDPFEFKIKETENGFKNLREFVEKEVNND